ncbi:methionine gamma-lyase family protein [Salisediminibacterium beveridgei]|uniref:Aluminum resistance protein n=1 Tax=Salisediminibacterium beveridgei TaxID=632773 RepID=A0A1D7QVR2_9BACI|nr:methionine gamma-lyase family protein [Salisediminibacterium beveridgei]AOM83104.1 Aluminum resistance protein [Salisediminibacterium beveridgei]
MDQKDLIRIKQETEKRIRPILEEREIISEENQRKVLDAFQSEEIADFHLHGSTGYGYDDAGRERLEAIYAKVFKAEASVVRPQLVSGTHAISTALFGMLRPGDELMYITGAPYDTLDEVIGTRGKTNAGSLKDFGIRYQQIDLADGRVDFNAIKKSVSPATKMIGIQRSKGYASRPSFTINEIRDMITRVKNINEDLIVFVDNCYGEFVELEEPIEAGADIIAGSLIKNPGGGIAKSGGYLAGRKDLIELCGNRMTAPGIGLEGGATTGHLRDMLQGFFMAPHIVNQAVKGAVFTASLFAATGMNTTPAYDAVRTDLIQSVQFETRDQMIRFCQAIQSRSPVDAHVAPQPSSMPGYEDDVIMAAGAFIQGSSIELSADGPLREPYTAYVQGGLTYEHVKIAVFDALSAILTTETE